MTPLRKTCPWNGWRIRRIPIRRAAQQKEKNTVINWAFCVPACAVLGEELEKAEGAYRTSAVGTRSSRLAAVCSASRKNDLRWINFTVLMKANFHQAGCAGPWRCWPLAARRAGQEMAADTTSGAGALTPVETLTHTSRVPLLLGWALLEGSCPFPPLLLEVLPCSPSALLQNC